MVQKSVTLEEIGLQNFCVFLFWNTINPTHIQVSGYCPPTPPWVNICPKWEVTVKVGLKRRVGGQFPKNLNWSSYSSEGQYIATDKETDDNSVKRQSIKVRHFM